MTTKPEFEYIYIQPIKQKWKPGARLIPDKLKEEYYHEFLRYVAEEFRDSLVQAINRQRFKNNDLTRFKKKSNTYKGWPPLSLAYYRWKEKHKLSLKMWEATGFLKNSIEVIPRKAWGGPDHIIVGFREFTIYPDKNVTPLMISRVLEFGNDKIPPRPLFTPLYFYMRKHSRKYWENFKGRKGI